MKSFHSLKTLSVITLAAALVSVTSAALPQRMAKANMIEDCSHQIIKLVAAKKLPPEAASKLHLVQVVDAAGGYRVVAVLDHNGDHSQTPANILFNYSKEMQMMGFQYRPGYITPLNTPFNVKSTARLFDLAVEFMVENPNPVFKNYAQELVAMHLEHDKAKNAALFEMMDTQKRQFNVLMSLDGRVLNAGFVNR